MPPDEPRRPPEAPAEQPADRTGAGRTAAGGRPESVISLLRQYEQAESRVRDRRESVAEEEQRRQGRDRSQIARIIVYLFAASFLFVLAAVPLLALAAPTAEWTAVTEKLLALVSSVLLPVVTLVIGFYFGTEQSRLSRGSDAE